MSGDWHLGVCAWLPRASIEISGQGQTAVNHKRISCCTDCREFITYTWMTIATCKITRVNGPLGFYPKYSPRWRKHCSKVCISFVFEHGCSIPTAKCKQFFHHIRMQCVPDRQGNRWRHFSPRSISQFVQKSRGMRLSYFLFWQRAGEKGSWIKTACLSKFYHMSGLRPRVNLSPVLGGLALPLQE